MNNRVKRKITMVEDKTTYSMRSQTYPEESKESTMGSSME
jgi:hypothetical protein